jgi:hypothetical protein
LLCLPGPAAAGKMARRFLSRHILYQSFPAFRQLRAEFFSIGVLKFG